MGKNKFDTDAIRSGYQRTDQQEHSEAIFTTSSFVFDSAKRLKKDLPIKKKVMSILDLLTPLLTPLKENLHL